MFVCVCNAVSDRSIKAAVAEGAQSLGDLKDRLGVATCCGCCAELASSFFNETGAAQTNQAATITANGS